MRGPGFAGFAAYACLVACARTPPPRAPTIVVPTPIATGAKLGEPNAHPPTQAPSAAKTKLECTGTPSSELRRAVDATITDSRNCLYETLARDPNASGLIVLGVLVQADGTISKIVTLDRFQDPETSQCIVGVFAHASYTSTPPENGCVIFYIPVDLIVASVRNAGKAAPTQ